MYESRKDIRLFKRSLGRGGRICILPGAGQSGHGDRGKNRAHTPKKDDREKKRTTRETNEVFVGLTVKSGADHTGAVATPKKRRLGKK